MCVLAERRAQLWNKVVVRVRVVAPQPVQLLKQRNGARTDRMPAWQHCKGAQSDKVSAPPTPFPRRVSVGRDARAVGQQRLRQIGKLREERVPFTAVRWM